MQLTKNTITLPDTFTDTVSRIFGKQGQTWLSQLDDILYQARVKWHLSNIHLADNLSINLICFAESPDYGSIVLKIGPPNPELDTEILALSLYQGKAVCTCYDSDLTLGAMLLERVQPGYNLKAVPEDVCLDVGINIIAELPTAIQGQPALPYFSDWTERAYAKVRTENKVGAQMLFYVEQAERFFDEIVRQEPLMALLHGDLHHENILYSGNGGWKVIDPKGVIGVPCLETGRFIQNHMDVVDRAERQQSLATVTEMFGAAFQRPPRTVAMCAFIDCVLSRCWTFEEYLSPTAFAEAETEALESCALYFDFINGL